MNFTDFSDGGTPANGDYIVGYAAGGAPGSDRRWTLSSLLARNNTWTGANTWNVTIALAPSFNTKGFRTDNLGYDDVSVPLSTNFNFNEVNLDDYSSANVASGFASTITLHGDSGSNWGSKNTITEKRAGTFELQVFTAPTGTGPQQAVAISATARIAPGVGSCPNMDLFSANYTSLAASPMRTLVGTEYDLQVDAGAGGSCQNKVGTQMITSGSAGTSLTDTAYVLGSGDGGTTKWVYGYTWYPNSISGTIIGSSFATSCVNGLDLSAATFSGSQIRLALGSNLKNAANDGAAAGAGVAVGEVYRNGSVLMVRVT